ncbi:MAG TPA: efflux transporter outer membrane subunit [Methylocella sp.]|nr:efflux transporter outer membrane subunit [Methylocella sp.]
MISRSLFLGACASLTLLFAGCAWMPSGEGRADFLEPPAMKSILPNARPQEAAAAKNRWPDDRWWQQFKSPDLDRIMEIALKDDPGLKKAYARFSEADAETHVEGARLLPWLDSDNTLRQLRYAEHGVVAAYNPALGGAEKTSDTFNAFSIRYEFDFWGKNHAMLEAALGEAAAQEAELAEARLLLTTSVARAYVRGATLAQQLALAEDMVKVGRESLNVEQTRFRTGLGTADDVMQANLDLENAIRIEASTRGLLIVQQNLLARLMGEGPDATQNLFARERVSIPAKIALPASLPIELLAHRPDLASAMHRAEAAAERIHVAKAQFLPSIDLSAATAGLEASVATKNIGTLAGLVFRGGALNYVVAPGVHLPLFEGGRLRGLLSAARSQYDEAVELYNDTLLHAVQEVADSLSNWKQTRTILKAHRSLLSSTRTEAGLTQVRQHTGLTDRREILRLQHGFLDQQFALKASEADNLIATIDVIQALGGGYSNGINLPRPQLAPEESLSGLETLTPAWALEKLVSPPSPFFQNSK